MQIQSPVVGQTHAFISILFSFYANKQIWSIYIYTVHQKYNECIEIKSVKSEIALAVATFYFVLNKQKKKTNKWKKSTNNSQPHMAQNLYTVAFRYLLSNCSLKTQKSAFTFLHIWDWPLWWLHSCRLDSHPERKECTNIKMSVTLIPASQNRIRNVH